MFHIYHTAWNEIVHDKNLLVFDKGGTQQIVMSKNLLQQLATKYFYKQILSKYRQLLTNVLVYISSTIHLPCLRHDFVNSLQFHTNHTKYTRFINLK